MLALLLLFLVLPGSSVAQEQRCSDLGSNCICSNNLDTPSWVNPSSNWYYESNTPAGGCGEAEFNGQPASWFASGAPQSVTETGMPAGNQVTNVVQLNGTGGATMFTVEPISALSGRVCARHYEYLSSNYQSTNDGACTNDKLIQLGDYLTAFNTGYTSSNAGSFSPNILRSDTREKWARIEMCVNSLDNPTTLEFYYQNITDGTAEQSFSVAARLAQDPGAMDNAYVINAYRQDTCLGFRRVSHSLLAVWPTNAGQRIGAASEVEGGGGGGDTEPPSAPTNLTATASASSAIALDWDASTDDTGVVQYNIKRCSGAACTPTTVIDTVAGAPPATAYNDTGLAAETLYRYRVNAQDAVPNVSADSSVAEDTTDVAPDTTAPTDPSNLTATTQSHSRIDLDWDASTDATGVVVYRIERCSGASCGNFAEIDTVTGSPPVSAYSNTELAENTLYRYRVRAADVVPNTSGYSNIAEDTTDNGPLTFLGEVTSLLLTGDATIGFLANPSALSLSGDSTVTALSNPSGLSLSGENVVPFLSNPSSLEVSP